MKWDKSPYEKKKNAEVRARIEKEDTLGTRIQNFLTGQHRGRIEWPDYNILIGTMEKPNGDANFAIYYKGETGIYVISTGDTLDEALEAATKHFRSKLDENNPSN